MISTCGALAQEKSEGLQKPPLPKGPIVRKISDNEAWRISIGSLSSEEKTYSNLMEYMINGRGNEGKREVFLRRVKPVWHISMKGQEKTYEIWSDGYQMIDKDSTKEKFGLLDFGSNNVDEEGITEEELYNEPSIVGEIANSISGDEFPGFRGLKPKHYQGVEEFNGQLFQIFQRGSVTLWVFPKTKEPIAWNQGNEVRVFKRVNASGKIKIPQDIKAIFEKFKKDRDVLFVPPAYGG
ncbi:MAG: hypothetical protein AAFY98_00270 [Verrucomicrobiota bacterium]